MLVGSNLVRAGRGALAYRVAAGWAVLFAATVTVALFAFPDWMYVYAAQVPPGLAAVPFFVAVAGAGAAGAYVTRALLTSGRTGWAIACAVAGVVVWAAGTAATLDAYTHVGSYAQFHAGVAPLGSDVPAFARLTAVIGAIEAVAGVAAAIFLWVTGARAIAASRVLPDPAPAAWRAAADGPLLAVPQSPSVIEDGAIRGVKPGGGGALPPVPVTPRSSIPALVERARAAADAWAALPVKKRAAALRLVKKRFLLAAEEMAALLEEEIGRPRAESYLAEIVPDADLFDYWCRSAPFLLQPEGVSIDPITFPGKRGVVERIPRGVIAVISPWNFPVALPLRAIVPALVAGNAVVFKPSEYAARTGARLVELFRGVIPEGLLTLVQGGGAEGQAIIEAGVDAVFFTGSPRIGRAVAEAAARALTPVYLELGGKDAAIVLDDADLDRAARGIVWGAFANAGQNCAAVERCYVMKSVAERFTRKLVREISALRVGPGPEGEVDIGPLTTPAQHALVMAQLEQARSRGTRPAVGGEAGPAHFVRPALILDPPEDLSLVAEETFGPVLPVIAVEDEEEAVRRANRSAYGLTASVWSRDAGRAERLARRIHAGVLTVNNHAFTGGLPQAPWSGVRASGSGVTSSRAMLAELTRPRFVLVDRSRAGRELWWYPYDRSLLRIGRGMSRLRSGAPGKLSALREVVGGFLSRSRA